MHKLSSSDPFPKLRPIVLSIGTFNYNLARFLCDLLSSLVPDDYSCKYTFPFLSQIKNANLSSKFLVSHVVSSLLTNILLQETIDSNRSHFHKKLFLFVTSQTYFLFNGKYYNQIDGVAMGSPFTPVLAIFFMGF